MSFTSDEMAALRTQLCDEAEVCGIVVTSQQADLLLKHLDLVIQKNKVMNLTRIVDTSDAVTKHIVDSLLFVKALGEQVDQGKRFLDLGTGAGFPGIPFGVVTGMRGLLVDSVGKKVTAVESFINELELAGQLDARAIRAEELAKVERGRYHVVCARAVAELNVLIEYAAPLLAKGGVLVASKAHVSQEELDNAAYAASICGMRLVSRETCELPRDAGHRELYRYEKVKKPQIALPRNTGMAKHKPLVRQSHA